MDSGNLPQRYIIGVWAIIVAVLIMIFELAYIVVRFLNFTYFLKKPFQALLIVSIYICTYYTVHRYIRIKCGKV